MVVYKYKYLGVHLNNKLDWLDNMDTFTRVAKVASTCWGDWGLLESAGHY